VRAVSPRPDTRRCTRVVSRSFERLGSQPPPIPGSTDRAGQRPWHPSRGALRPSNLGAHGCPIIAKDLRPTLFRPPRSRLAMSSSATFSDKWRREEREERERLRQLEGRLDSLQSRRRALLDQVRALSSKQRELYSRGQGPQSEAERLYQESGELGRHLAGLRRSCEAARAKLEEAVIRRRELVLTFDRGERLNPDQVRREMAELELRQQTRALPIDEENALIARLRQMAKDLQQFEARKEAAAEHELQRRTADAAIVAARAEVDRIVKEMEVARTERDKRRVEIPAKLEAAGNVVAEMRVAGRTRAELMPEVDSLGREIAEVEREGRELLARYRQRQEIAREIMAEYARPLSPPPPDGPATVEGSPVEEPVKRGRTDPPP